MPTASILAEKVLGYIFTLPLLGANVWCRGVAWCAAGCVVRCGLRGALRAAAADGVQAKIARIENAGR
ncbi:hypothetical protein PR001_g13225 [Phytophthora rubi]|uniref:Uncharacterized protein n=1 Tax=Phytophthora rubi TaxID=129364 RepID=A0A6A3LCS7_9STRA|nr:hypothetical protein PR002_g13557 [Phytophthora rubi]KAE9022097.1 hypothetical protein PR001_g13225 [Phytophthora rubi]